MTWNDCSCSSTWSGRLACLVAMRPNHVNTAAMAQPIKITLVLAQAQESHQKLIGQDLNELIPVIPVRDVRHAIHDSLPALISNTASAASPT